MKSLNTYILMAFLSLGIFQAEAKESLSMGDAVLCADEVEHDFGVKLRRKGDLHHTFIIKNSGTTPLVITKVVTSCSCIKSNYSRRPIAAGEECKFKVTYEMKKMPLGSFSKSLLIYSNTKSGEAVKLTVTGRSQQR